MGKELGPILLLVLLLFHNANTDSKAFCPYRCQCFTSIQVLCSDGGLLYLPRNLSREVKDFILISSDVQYLFAQTLGDSPQLNRLIFLNNSLRNIHAQAFEHLAELRELEISGNPMLEHLNLGTFSKLGNLSKLGLNFNRIQTVLLGTFEGLTQLKTLQMKGNILSDLPTSLFINLHNLRVLDLSQNKIRGVAWKAFSGLAGLEILRLSNNLISNLTSNTFQNLSQLTELHLEWNKISELDDHVFFGLTNLKVLKLRGNLLTTFSDKVFGFEAPSLEELNLKGNRLKELSSLSCLTSLSDITLSSNQLSNLPEDIFQNMTALEYLDLSENQLTSLPKTVFSGLLGIKAIYLNQNNLSKLEPEQFEEQPLIQQLYLSDNRLETLPPGIFDSFTIQHTVRLHGNPWKCDCHMQYLHDWVLKNSQDIEMLDRMLCESPGFLRRRPVAAVDKDQLVCALSKNQTAEVSRCGQEAQDGTVVVTCRVDKCSPLTVRVQFQGDDGTIREYTLKNEAEC